jgi:hypothetical protein
VINRETMEMTSGLKKLLNYEDSLGTIMDGVRMMGLYNSKIENFCQKLEIIGLPRELQLFPWKWTENKNNYVCDLMSIDDKLIKQSNILYWKCGKKYSGGQGRINLSKNEIRELINKSMEKNESHMISNIGKITKLLLCIENNIFDHEIISLGTTDNNIIKSIYDIL